MTALYVILIIIALICLLLLLPIDCAVDFSYNKENSRGAAVIRYAFFSLKIYPLEKEIKEAEEETEKEAEKEERELDPWGVIELVRAVYNELWDEISAIIGQLFKRTIRIKELNISAKFGTGNPMYTGIATGAVNSFVYNTLALIDNNMTLDGWHVSLEPDFNNKCLGAGVYAKIRTSIKNIIALGFKAALLLLKIQKINRRIKKNG